MMKATNSPTKPEVFVQSEKFTRSEAVVPLLFRVLVASCSVECLTMATSFVSYKNERVWKAYMKKQNATKWINICRQLSLDMKLRSVILPLQPTCVHWRRWGIDAGQARPLSTIKETNFYLKRKHNYWTVNPIADEQ